MNGFSISYPVAYVKYLFGLTEKNICAIILSVIILKYRDGCFAPGHFTDDAKTLGSGI